MSIEKEFAYLLKLSSSTNSVFDLFKKRLGWGKRETISRLLVLFREVVEVLDRGTELSIIVRNEREKNTIIEKIASFDSLQK